jgi:rod shape-determining protein MreD
MHWPRFAVLVLIATLLQKSWIDTIAVTDLRVTPDLLLIALTFFAIRCNETETIISSFALGFAADIAAPGFSLGPMIISFGVFGTGLSYLHRLIAIKKVPHEAITIFAIGAGTGCLAWLLARVAGQTPRLGGFGALIGTSIYSAVLGPVLFLLLDWLMRIKSRRRGRK